MTNPIIAKVTGKITEYDSENDQYWITFSNGNRIAVRFTGLSEEHLRGASLIGVPVSYSPDAYDLMRILDHARAPYEGFTIG